MDNYLKVAYAFSTGNFDFVEWHCSSFGACYKNMNENRPILWVVKI